MRKLLVLITVMLMVGGASFANVNTKVDFVKTFQSKQGTVTFNHKTHSELQKCESCHGVFSKGINKDAAHKLCKECHIAMAGPAKCVGCHKK